MRTTQPKMGLAWKNTVGALWTGRWIVEKPLGFNSKNPEIGNKFGPWKPRPSQLETKPRVGMLGQPNVSMDAEASRLWCWE